MWERAIWRHHKSSIYSVRDWMAERDRFALSCHQYFSPRVRRGSRLQRPARRWPTLTTTPLATVIRFETPAGGTDKWISGKFRFPFGVRALLVVFGYSRLLWCRFSPPQDLRTLLGRREQLARKGAAPLENFQ